MLKTAFCEWPTRGGNRSITKTLLVMNLTVFFLTAAILNVSAKGVSQNVTFSGKNVSLEKVFTAVEQQTGLLVLYSKAKFVDTRPVTVEAKNMALLQFLDVILKGQSLKYVIESKTIIVSPSIITTTPLSSVFTDNFLPPITVRGRIINENGDPVIASITIKGTTRGITSNADGSFEITGVDDKATLIISAANIETREIKLNGSGDLATVNVKIKNSPLDEVQIIAYGNTSKRLTTGNIGSVKADVISRQPVGNPLLALTGRIPGLTITQSTGLPGSAVTVRVQGQNSIAKGNNPFYVVDGVPYIGQQLRTLSTVLGVVQGGDPESAISAGSPFTYLNPADIESIEVLKDGDATAIYGSKAANGAILITTKKGKSGRTNVDVTVQNGIGQVGHFMDLMNTQQYLQMRREAYFNDGLSYPSATTPKLSNNYDITVWDTTRNTNWQKELIGGTAHYTDMQGAISGGTTYTSFRINGGYHKETTVFGNQYGDTKGSFGLNINHSTPNNKLKIQSSVNFLNDNNNLVRSDLTRYILIAPNAPVLRNSVGGINWQRILLPGAVDSTSTFDNPLAALEGKSSIKSNNFIGSTNISYTLFKGFTVRSNFGYTFLESQEINTIPFSGIKPELRPGRDRTTQYGQSKISSWIFEPQLTYQTTISKGIFEALLGTTFQKRSSQLQQLSADGFSSDALMDSYVFASTLSTGIANAQSVYKYNAAFARLNYNWQNRYIINLTGRRDGSSRFGSEKRFHNFGAVGGAWIISNEEFVKNNAGWLGFAKLKASYGTTGNDQINDYAYLNIYEGGSYPVNYQGVTILSPNGFNNPYLQWELTKKLSLGFDLGFLKDRLLLSANYYRNRSSNQLLNYNLPSLTGSTFVPLNFPATVENSGLELGLNTVNIKSGSFSWGTDINLTIARNKLVSFPNIASSSYNNSLVVGQPLGITKLYKAAGVNPQTGLYQFVAANGNVVASPNSSTDRTYIQSSMPTFFGGIGNSLSFKEWRLDFFLEFKKQNQRTTDLGLAFYNGLFNYNAPVTALDRWKNPGDNASVQKYSALRNFINYYLSDAFYGDASYLRLKNVSLSWTLPSEWSKNIHLQGAKVFIQGQNLLTITKFNGFDPENFSVSSLPPLRVITAGIQVTL
jgi:TonB-dependent starch-binding outer membrane protein SusC